MHWRTILANPTLAHSEDELKKAEKLVREIESFDIDVVAMDISQDGESPFYRKGNLEWDQGYVRMRVRDNNSLPHVRLYMRMLIGRPLDAHSFSSSPLQWLRRRWMSVPGKAIMDDEETEDLASNDDRAGVNEKNLPALWRKWPRLPQLLTDALFDKVVEIEGAGGPQAYANRLYGNLAAAESRQANGDSHNGDDMHIEVAPEIAFMNFLERAASASPHPSRSNTPAPAFPSGYGSPPPPQQPLLIQSPHLQNPLSPFTPAVHHHAHVMPPPQQISHHGHVHHPQPTMQNAMMQQHIAAPHPVLGNGTPILSPRPMHAAGGAPTRFAAAVSAASPAALEPPTKRRKLTGSTDGTDKMQVDSLEYAHDLTGATGLITPSQFFASDSKPEPNDLHHSHNSSVIASAGSQAPSISINGISDSQQLLRRSDGAPTPHPLASSQGAIPLPSALVDSTLATPVAPLAFANIMQQYFQHVSQHITAKETENAALLRRVKKLKASLRASRRSEGIAKTTLRFLRMHPPSSGPSAPPS